MHGIEYGLVLLTSFLTTGKLAETRASISSSLNGTGPLSQSGPQEHRLVGNSGLRCSALSLGTVPALSAVVDCAERERPHVPLGASI